MLRELLVNDKTAIATFTADVAMVRGMGVQKNGTEAILPTAASAANIFFVDKQPIPTGLNTLKGELSDYDTAFENIAVGDYVVLKKYSVGEVIATDQVNSTAPADGEYLVVGTDGKLVTTTTANVVTPMICRGTYTDCGTHTLYKVEFIEPYTIPAG